MKHLNFFKHLFCPGYLIILNLFLNLFEDDYDNYERNIVLPSVIKEKRKTFYIQENNKDQARKINSSSPN